MPRAPPAHAANVEMPKTDTHVTFQHSLRLPTQHPPRINMNFLLLLVATNRAETVTTRAQSGKDSLSGLGDWVPSEQRTHQPNIRCHVTQAAATQSR